MPNTNPPTNPEELAKHNVDVATKQKDQDISGKPTATGDFGDATDALDKLAAQIQPKPDDKATPPAPKPDEDLEKHKKRAEEIFKDSPSLSANASPKSAEAFSSIKVKAAQEISARDQQIAELQQQLKEAKNPSPEILQQQKELEEHRQWRVKMDVDFDPKFKEFDSSISSQRDFIYAQLSKSPAVTAETIEQIKKYGGPDNIDLSKLFESIKDTTLQRLVESKVADIEMAKYNKKQAIESAKANVEKYMEGRKQELSKTSQANQKEATSRAEQILGQFDWFAEKKPAPDADASAKQEAAEHNKFLAEMKPQLSVALQDDSPEMRAVMVAGLAQLFNLQRRLPALEASLKEKTEALAEVTEKWEAVKRSSQSRLNESQAPAGGISQPRKEADINLRSQDALDNIARQVMETRAQAAAGQ